jgi:hypothetical protein
MSQEIAIDINNSVNKSAQDYFDEYKKMKKKLVGLDNAVADMQKKLDTLSMKKIERKETQEKKKLLWYEKYHWGFTKNNFLIIAGKDSASNEYIVKNYLEKDDLLFHSTIQGSAHVILKNGQKADKEDLEDCALFAAIFSKAWNLGFASVDVYFVYPDQVSKTAETGEYVSQGAFVIRGEKNFFKKIQMKLSLGICDISKFDKTNSKLRIFIGSEKLLQEKGIKIIAELIPGKDKKGDIAKNILSKLDTDQKKEITLDEIVQALPPGTMEFVRNKKK